MSLPEILGFANAMSSVGIEAEAGGSAMSRVFAKIGTAVMDGGKALTGFAQVAGVSGAQFQKSFRDDAAGTVISFVEGLDRIKSSGGNVYEVLKSLDIKDIRSIDTLLRLAGAGDLARKSIEDGNEAWQKGTALQDEARKRYETTAAQLEILKNRAIDFGITVGNAVVPELVKLLPHLDALGTKVESWGPQIQSGVNIAKTALGGLGSIAQTSIGSFGIVATASAVTFSAAMSKIVASYKAMRIALAATNPWGMAAVAVGLFAGALYTVVTAGERTSQALRDARAALDALKGTADSARGAQLSLAEAKNRLKQATLDVQSAIKTQQQAEESAGRGSLQYRQAQNQVEAAYVARQRAALQVGLAEDQVLKTQKEATATQTTAKAAVQALTAQYKAMEERATAYAGAGDRASASAKGIERTKAALFAKDYADKMRDLGDRAAKAAKDLETTNPALAKIAAGISKAAKANAEFATETSKIPATIQKVSGPAAAQMDAVGRAVAGKASSSGATVGANFAQGMAAGIAANASAAAIQAALMVNHAYSAASTAGQMHSPSRLTWQLGAWFVEGFAGGMDGGLARFTPAAQASWAKFVDGIKTTIETRTTALSTSIQGLNAKFSEAFGTRTQQLVAALGSKFDEQIAKVRTWQSELTSAERALQGMTVSEAELAALDRAEGDRGRTKAVQDAEEALAKAKAIEDAEQRAAAILAAEEQLRVAQLAITRQRLTDQAAAERAALQAQAAEQRAARDAEAAEQIKYLEETKARDLKNLEDLRAVQQIQMEKRLAELAAHLQKHPREWDKTQAAIIKLLAGYGIDYRNSGEKLGSAFAYGLRQSFDEVEKAAKELAKIPQAYLRLKSPAEKGPLSDDIGGWLKPLGAMVASGIDGRKLEIASSRLASSVAFGAGAGNAGTPLVSVAGSPSPSLSTATGGQGGGDVHNHNHFHFDGPFYGDERGLEELTRKIQTQLRRHAGRN